MCVSFKNIFNFSCLHVEFSFLRSFSLLFFARPLWSGGCLRGRGRGEAGAGLLAGQVEPRQKLVFDRPLSSYVPQLSSSLLSSGCQRHSHSTPPLPPCLHPGIPVPILAAVLSCCSLLHSVGVVKKYHYMRHIWQVCSPFPYPFPLTPPPVLSSLEHCINCRRGAKAASIVIWLYVLGVAAGMG